MIGDTLRQIRKLHGYTIIQMSAWLDISQSYISEIEHDHKKPSLEILQNCADIYGIRLSTLIRLHEDIKEIQESEKKTIPWYALQPHNG